MNKEEREDITTPARWLQMLDTRYTKWNDVGTETEPGLTIQEKGPYFECAE